MSPGPKLWRFPLYFEPIMGEIRGFLRQRFPLEFRAHLYGFRIRRSKGMGKDRELNNPRCFGFLGARAPLGIARVKKNNNKIRKKF